MLRSVTLVRADVSEERVASIIRVTRISELGTTLAVTSNQRTQRRNNTVLWYLPDDEGATFRRNVGSYKSHTT
jgi:hypothetical protein